MPPKLKLTDHTRHEIARLLAAGSTLTFAARSVDISVRSLEAWMAKGRAARAAVALGREPTPADLPFLALLDEIDTVGTELTDATRQQISNLLQMGVSLETASLGAGVQPALLGSWLARVVAARDRKAAGVDAWPGDDVYLRFDQDISQSDALAEIQSLASVRKAALNGDWRAAAWMLERKHPEKYAKRDGRGGAREGAGRPVGASSAPDRPSTGDPPPRIRLVS